jgi:protein SCO1/2
VDRAAATAIGHRWGAVRFVARIVVCIVLTLGIGAGTAGCAANDGSGTLTPVMVEPITPPPFGSRDTAYNPPRAAPPLQLTDQDGRPFDLSSLRGTPVFVYFGYTHCPDICPTTIADLRDAIARAAVPAQVVYVTIDPARDDVAAMKQYVSWYKAGYIGLTGTESQIAEAATAWGVSYRRLESASASGYAMAHSTDTYLIDADGALRHHLFFGAGADLIARRLREVAGR